MPAAIFVSIRLEPPRVIKAERSKWDRIAALFAQMHYEEANVHPLAEFIVQEFTRPLPEHFPIGDKAVTLAPAGDTPATDWVKGA